MEPESPLRHPEPEDVVLSFRQREQKQRMLVVLEALEAGHSRSSAASMAGVSGHTVSSWISKGRKQITHLLYPWFYHEVSRTEGLGEQKFADIVIREATENHNWRAAMFVLTKRYTWSGSGNVDNELQREQQQAQLDKTRADTAYVEARTKSVADGDGSSALARLKELLDEVREERKSEVEDAAIPN